MFFYLSLCIFMYNFIIGCLHFDHRFLCLCIHCLFYCLILVICNNPLFLFVLPFNPASASINTIIWFSQLAHYKIHHFLLSWHLFLMCLHFVYVFVHSLFDYFLSYFNIHVCMYNIYSILPKLICHLYFHFSFPP